MGENQKVERIEKLNYGTKQSEDYVTEEICYLLLRQGQKRDKKLEVQLFLACLLVLLTGWLCFYLVLEVSTLDLIVGLVISGAKLIGGEVAISLLG